MDSVQYRYIVGLRSKLANVFTSILNVKYDDDVLLFLACQSALETGYGTSVLYRVNHNLFGMRQPSVRPSKSYRVRYNHAAYHSDVDSILDYYWWMLWNKFSYRSFLMLSVFKVNLIDGRFNPSSKYVDKINSIVESFKQFENHEC